MPICPKCKQRFEGKPNFCPHCGAKFNWPSAQQQAAAPAPKPAPRPARPSDDDLPVDTRQYQARARRQPTYALVTKILMISFCGAGLLFLTIGLLCFFAPFISDNVSGLDCSASGFALAFNFTNDALKYGGQKLTESPSWIIPLISLGAVGALIGLSIPRLLKDIKFFKAKENTRAVQKRRNKAVFNLILYCSIALVAIILIAITKATTKFVSGASGSFDLGGGAIVNIVFLVFFIGFVVAEEVVVLTTLHIGPRRPRYVEEPEEEMPEIE